MFQITTAEKLEVVTNCDHLSRLKFSKSLPYAFTEHGAIQAANVLASPRSIDTLRELMTPPATAPKHPIGFVTPDDRSAKRKK